MARHNPKKCVLCIFENTPVPETGWSVTRIVWAWGAQFDVIRRWDKYVEDPIEIRPVASAVLTPQVEAAIERRFYWTDPDRTPTCDFWFSGLSGSAGDFTEDAYGRVIAGFKTYA